MHQNDPTEQRWTALALLSMVCALLLLRSAAQICVPLMPQEAYYWMYAQHPSLSYFDHPPMVAWMIGLGNVLFSDAEWGVRSIGGLLMLLNGWLIYHFAGKWWNRQVAILSAVFIELAPVFLGFGLLATMDAGLLSFWLIALIGMSRAVQHNSAAGWYIFGVGVGGAMLSKYTGVFLIPGAGLLLLSHRPWREQLRHVHFYLGALLGLAMFWPVLFWNWRHDWVSFRFQFTDRFAIGQSSHRHTMLEFIGLQFGVATPLVLLALPLIAAVGLRRRRLRAREKMALAFALPMLLMIGRKAWSYPAHINWTAPAYAALIPAAWQFWSVYLRARRKRGYWRIGVAGPTLAGCFLVSAALLTFLLIPSWRLRVFRIFGPWDDVATQVDHFEDVMEAQGSKPPIVIAGGHFELASELAYYRRHLEPAGHAVEFTTSSVALGGEGFGYDFWPHAKLKPGDDCLYVEEHPEDGPDLTNQFTRIVVAGSGRQSNGRSYRFVQCFGYVGIPATER